MMNLMQVPPTVLYADTVNSQFHKSQSHYVNLAQRLDASVNSTEWYADTIESSKKEFKLRNPTINKWDNLSFCRAETTTLDKIDIDITLQRKFDLMHACRIIDKFKQILVMPICVYEDPIRPGKFICWDGQHTSLVLFIIATGILNEDPTTCQIPIVVYASHQKSEMRQCFIELNGDAKQPLDQIDIFQQKVFGVRTDSSTNADWVLNEQKQTALESAKMFATNEKFYDTKQPGALTVLTELVNIRDFDLEITQAFCKYFVAVCKSSRPVQPKESWMMYMYFNLCERSGITLDQAYITSVAKALQVVNNNDFDAQRLWEQGKASYQNWFLRNKPNPDGTLWGISYPEKRLGLTMLLAQIAKAGVKTPSYHETLWHVPAKDLF